MDIEGLREGERVAGHELVARMGRGSGGEVWRATFGGQSVALKLFRSGSLSTRLAAESIAQYALSRGADPRARYFARAEHWDLESDPPYLRMELVEGRSLRDALAAGPLGEAGAARIGEALLEALAYAHEQGFAHGDLKPENVLLPAGGGPAVKLIDAGFGRLVAEDLSSPDVLASLASLPAGAGGVSTPRYAPPERWTPAYRTDLALAQAADLYMAGKVLYETLTGRSPETILPPSRAAGVTAAWDELVFALVEADPKRRPSARQALERLRAIRPGVAAGPAPVPEPAPPPARPSWLWMPMGIFLLPAVTGVVVAALYLEIPALSARAVALPAHRSTAADWSRDAGELAGAGLVQLAEFWHRQALRRDPAHGPSLAWLAERNATQGDLPAAHALYLRWTQSHPGSADAHYGLGLVLLRLKRMGEAREAAREAARLAPDKAMAANLLGQIALDEGDAREALAAFETASRLDPRSPIGHNNRGMALLRLNRQEEARAAFERVLALDPWSAEALFNLAVLAFDAGKDGEVAECLRRLRRAAPGQETKLLGEFDKADPRRAEAIRQALSDPRRRD